MTERMAKGYETPALHNNLSGDFEFHSSFLMVWTFSVLSHNEVKKYLFSTVN